MNGLRKNKKRKNKKQKPEEGGNNNRLLLVLGGEKIVALNLGELTLKCSADYQEAIKETRNFTSEIQGLQQKTVNLSKFATPALLAIGAAAAAAGVQGIKLATDFEQIQIAFKTILGSAQDAKILLGQLYDFAAKTPFEFPEITAASKQMLAFGIEADKIIPTLKMIGDVSSGIGAPLSDMAYLFGTIKTQGRAMTMDLMQFANRGVPIFESLAQVMGTSTSQIRKLAEQGKIGFAEIEKAFALMTGEGGKFAKMMEEQSKTINGLLSTLRDNFNMILRDFGEMVLGGVNAEKNLQVLIEWAGKLRESLIMVGALGSLAFNKIKIAFLTLVEKILEGWKFIFQLIPGSNKLFDWLISSIQEIKTETEKDIFIDWQHAVERLNGAVGKLGTTTKNTSNNAENEAKKLQEHLAVIANMQSLGETIGGGLGETIANISKAAAGIDNIEKGFKALSKPATTSGFLAGLNSVIGGFMAIIGLIQVLGNLFRSTSKAFKFPFDVKAYKESLANLKEFFNASFVIEPETVTNTKKFIEGALGLDKISGKIRNIKSEIQGLQSDLEDKGTNKAKTKAAIALLQGQLKYYQDLYTKFSDKAALESAKAFIDNFTVIGKALESGVISGFGNGIKAFLQGKADWKQILTEGIYDSVLDGIVTAFLQSSIIKESLGPLMGQLTAVLAGGNFDLARGIIEQIAAVIPGIADKIATILDPISQTLSASFKDLNSTVNNVNSSMQNMPSGFKYVLNRFTLGEPIKMASGGYVPPRLGGTRVTLAEGGEGEYVVPASKMGGITINITGPVYGMDDFERKVAIAVNKAKRSNYTSGYGLAGAT